MWELDLAPGAGRSDRLVTLGAITLFAVLLGVTVIGVIENWPGGQSVRTPATANAPHSYDAHVVGLRAVPCQAPAAHHCEVVTLHLDGGPDKGRTTQVRFGDTGSDAQVSLNDAVLVYKNQLPPGARLAGSKLPAYSFSDFQRRTPMLWLLGLFCAVVIAAGGMKGVRSLIGLAASLATVVFFVVPAITHGKPPVQVAAFGALAIMFLTIPFVHGGGAKALAACLGTGLALLLTLGLADLFTSLAHLSGLNSDEAVYLESTTHVGPRSPACRDGDRLARRPRRHDRDAGVDGPCAASRESGPHLEAALRPRHHRRSRPHRGDREYARARLHRGGLADSDHLQHRELVVLGRRQHRDCRRTDRRDPGRLDRADRSRPADDCPRSVACAPPA